MNPKDYAEAIEKLISDTLAEIDGMLSAQEQAAIADLLSALAALSLNTAGNVKPTVSNLKVITAIQNRIDSILAGKDYEDAVKAAVESIVSMRDLIGIHLEASGLTVSGNIFDLLVNSAMAGMETALSATNYSPVAARINELMRLSVTSGASFRDLTRSLLSIVNLKDMGRTNVNTIVTDALGAFQGTYLEQASKRAKIKWFQYVGGIIDSTRKFCKERDGGYFHLDEITKWYKLDWDGKNPATGAQSIFTLRGGYNCQHSFFPVSVERVPERWKERYNQLKAQNFPVSVSV